MLSVTLPDGIYLGCTTRSDCLVRLWTSSLWYIHDPFSELPIGACPGGSDGEPLWSNHRPDRPAIRHRRVRAASLLTEKDRPCQTSTPPTQPQSAIKTDPTTTPTTTPRRPRHPGCATARIRPKTLNQRKNAEKRDAGKRRVRRLVMMQAVHRVLTIAQRKSVDPKRTRPTPKSSSRNSPLRTLA